MTAEVIIDTVAVEELKPYDRVVQGTFLGHVVAAQDLLVKRIQAADADKSAVTFGGLGTLFLHNKMLVSCIRATSESF